MREWQSFLLMFSSSDLQHYWGTLYSCWGCDWILHQICMLVTLTTISNFTMFCIHVQFLNSCGGQMHCTLVIIYLVLTINFLYRVLEKSMPSGVLQLVWLLSMIQTMHWDIPPTPSQKNGEAYRMLLCDHSGILAVHSEVSSDIKIWYELCEISTSYVQT